MTKLKTTKPLTEIQDVISQFPNYNDTKLEAEYDTMGNIIKIETDDAALIVILRAKGLVDE